MRRLRRKTFTRPGAQRLFPLRQGRRGGRLSLDRKAIAGKRTNAAEMSAKRNNRPSCFLPSSKTAAAKKRANTRHREMVVTKGSTSRQDLKRKPARLASFRLRQSSAFAKEVAVVPFRGTERRAHSASHRCDKYAVTERSLLDRNTFSKGRAFARIPPIGGIDAAGS